MLTAIVAFIARIRTDWAIAESIGSFLAAYWSLIVAVSSGLVLLGLIASEPKVRAVAYLLALSGVGLDLAVGQLRQPPAKTS